MPLGTSDYTLCLIPDRVCTMHHGRSRVTPTDNPGQFGTCLCTPSLGKPWLLWTSAQLKVGAQKFSLEKMLNAYMLGEKSWTLLGWGKTRLKHGHPQPRSLHIGLSHPEPCLDALSVLRPALQVSPSIRNLITRPADLVLCPLYPCLVPPWPLVSPLSPLVCVSLALRAVALLCLLSLYSQFLYQPRCPECTL